jgi:asparagine synthase (glutamine-hydrolysing)
MSCLLRRRTHRLKRRRYDLLRAPGHSDAYRNLVSIIGDTTLEALTSLGADAYAANAEWPTHHFGGRSLNDAMMLTDLVTYLPDDILTKVDRASMAHALEARVPLLDPRVVELALSLPSTLRLASGPKALLKDVLKRYVPAALVDRPKHGFGIPVHAWLRGQLRECLTDYLAPDALRRHGVLNTGTVTRMVHEHLSGTVDWGSALWAILMFQMWYEHVYCDFTSLLTSPLATGKIALSTPGVD